VVQGETQFGQCGGDGDGGGKLLRNDDQVIGKAGSGDGGQAAADVWPAQPFVIGFVLDLVADADEELAAGGLAQGRKRIRDVWCGQVRPADHARDQVAAGREGQERRGLLRGSDGLHDHGRGHSGRSCLGLEVGEGEVAA
jgi:hypothetical protein